MLADFNENFWKSGRKNRFGEELKILDFAWAGELTLDDTMDNSMGGFFCQNVKISLICYD